MKYIVLFLLMIVVRLQAQEIIQQPVANYITSFPFRMYTGGVMVVKAKFPDVKDSLNFILDTGGGGISLDSATCSNNNITTTETDTVVTGIGGRRKVHYVFNKSLRLPGLEINRLNFHVVNYEVLTSSYGEKIDGIMGFSFFNRYVVKVDFDSQLVEVYTRGKMKYPGGGALLHPVFTSLPIQQMQIKDRRKFPYYFYMDTGAGLSFLLNEKFVSDSNILHRKRRPLITQAEGMAGRLQMRLTVIKEVKIGPYRFTHVPTYLYDDVYNVTGYPFCGGLAGNDLLRRFNMIFNYSQREIHLLPNSHFTDPFDYSYNGLGIYDVNGKITVLDVIENSPAHKAGFKTDDEVISVGTNLSNNLQAYKTALQQTSEKIKVIVRRNGELLQLILKPVSILSH